MDGGKELAGKPQEHILGLRFQRAKHGETEEYGELTNVVFPCKKWTKMARDSVRQASTSCEGSAAR